MEVSVPTIAQIVEEDSNFKKVKGRKGLSDRESALLNASYVVAEAELSKLKVKFERKAGDERVALERVEAVSFIAKAASTFEGVGRWLNTPYLEFLPRKESEVKNIIGEVIDANELKNSNNKTSNAVSNKSDSKNDRVVAESLPGWSRPVVLFIEQTFAQMTPLTTAIWFFIIVIAFIALGFAQKSYLESNYDYISNENNRLKEQVVELNKKLESYGALESQSAQDKNIIDGLKSDNEQLKGKVQTLQENNNSINADFQRKIVDLQAQQQIAIAKFQENADAATKGQIEGLSQSKLRLEKENYLMADEIKQLKDKASDLKANLEVRDKAVAKQDNTIRGLNSTTEQQQEQIRSLQDERAQKLILVAFTNGVLELVNDVLYEPRMFRVNPYERRDDFTKGFEKLRQASTKPKLDSLGIREAM